MEHTTTACLDINTVKYLIIKTKLRFVASWPDKAIEICLLLLSRMSQTSVEVHTPAAAPARPVPVVNAPPNIPPAGLHELRLLSEMRATNLIVPSCFVRAVGSELSALFCNTQIFKLSSRLQEDGRFVLQADDRRRCDCWGRKHWLSRLAVPEGEPNALSCCG